ncbi:Fic family protein [Xanthomonas hyacinthi]|uniref:Fic family protein n=1 Tax=Xanthomonas hyacinthi TaxID=56455 RepID=UPI00360CD0A8
MYDWAGQIRQVEISKGSTMFARQVAIQSAAQQLFGQLAKEQLLRGLDADEFSKRAGHYLGEINVLHPFREGTAGRSVSSSGNWPSRRATGSTGAGSVRPA